jgi:hypothetical protein
MEAEEEGSLRKQEIRLGEFEGTERKFHRERVDTGLALIRDLGFSSFRSPPASVFERFELLQF